MYGVSSERKAGAELGGVVRVHVIFCAESQLTVDRDLFSHVQVETTLAGNAQFVVAGCVGVGRTNLDVVTQIIALAFVADVQITGHHILVQVAAQVVGVVFKLHVRCGLYRLRRSSCMGTNSGTCATKSHLQITGKHGEK